MWVMGRKELRKKEKGLDFFSKKTANHISGIYIVVKSSLYLIQKFAKC
ncbi:Uncharacterized protein FWK35_00013956 [Aphis craccivora]|uniref:Uncharacterized protein n=1 Tax=Aphis craccivora TaxID=307492 RepID=A0A6G0Z100_APHCR|nr:Uncharacterized protein FWK35_00013956 [Aphis craccivora]